MLYLKTKYLFIKKLKNTPIRTETIIREMIKGISKLSLKKKTPVVLANILNRLMTTKRKNCFLI